MDSRAQEVPEQEVLAGEVNDSLGMPESNDSASDSESEHEGEHQGSGHAKKRPTGWERLKQKTREQDRQIQELQSQLSNMQQSMMPNQSQMNPGMSEGQPSGIDEQIHKAVSYALNHRDLEEQKARQAKDAMHIQKQYDGLQGHLDRMNDKYDDFDDLVRGHDVPITKHMADASLFLPQSGNGSAGEVLYHLAKPQNRAELERIGSLHPLEQARELNKLSRSLELGGDKQNQLTHKTLGNIKSNPVTSSQGISEKTPVSELRAKLKAGGKRWY